MLKPTCFLVISFEAQQEHAASCVKIDDSSIYESLCALSPNIMKWDEATWIVDLEVCLDYWILRAKSLCDKDSLVDKNKYYEQCIQIWRSILDESFGHFRDESAGSYKFLTVLANHPWRGVLLCHHLRGRGLSGFVDLGTSFGKAQFVEVSWSVWWAAAECLGRNISALEPDFNLSKFSSHSRKMTRAMQRLGITKPSALAAVEVSSIKRRFGSVLARAWEWAFFGFKNSCEISSWDRLGFPWKTFKPVKNILHRRILEYGVFDWNTCANILLDDFNTIARSSLWHEDLRLLRVKWVLRYSDMSQEDLWIVFRNPYDLVRHSPYQKGALAQAELVFENNRSKKYAQHQDFCDHTIVSWDIEVEQTMHLSSRLSRLFDEVVDSKDREILDIENQISIPLQQYDMRLDWVPEDSYAPIIKYGTNKNPNIPVEYLCVSRQRPLYILRQPMKLHVAQNEAKFCFQEESMCKWWREAVVSGDEQRLPQHKVSFYFVKLRSGACYWVSSTGESFCINGIYA